MNAGRLESESGFGATMAAWAVRVMQANLDFAAALSQTRETLAMGHGDPAPLRALDALREQAVTLSRALEQADYDRAAQECVHFQNTLSDCVDAMRALSAEQAKSYAGVAPVAGAGAAAELQQAGELLARLDDPELLADQLSQTMRERDAARAELAALKAAIEQASVAGRMTSTPPEAVSDGSGGGRRRIGDILVSAGMITQMQLDDALEAQRRDPQRRLGSILVELGFTGEDIVAQVLASQTALPYVHLEHEPVDLLSTRLISRQLATRHMVIPIRCTPSVLTLAMANPLDLVAIDDVERAANRRVDPVVATRTAISEAIVRYYSI